MQRDGAGLTHGPQETGLAVSPREVSHVLLHPLVDGRPHPAAAPDKPGEGAAGGGPVGGAGEGEAEGHAHVDARAEVRDGDGRVEIDSGCGCEETLVKHSPGWRSQGKII